MFQYQRTLSQVTSEKPFVVQTKTNKHYIVAPLTHAHALYDAERMNLVFRGEESSRVHALGAFGDHVVTGTEDKEVRFSHRGRTVAVVGVGDVPSQILAFHEYIVVVCRDGSMHKLEVSAPASPPVQAGHLEVRCRKLEIQGIEKPVEYAYKPEGYIDKILLSVDGSLVLANARKERTLCELTSWRGVVREVKESPHPEIIGIAHEGGVAILNIKKDQEVLSIEARGARTIAFRRDGEKELAVGTRGELVIFCLEAGTVKSRKKMEEIHHMEYLGEEAVLLVSTPNNLSLWHYKDAERPYLLKEREGITVRGSEGVASSFMGDRVVLATKDKVFHVSLRRDEQCKRMLLNGDYGDVKGISARKRQLFVHYAHGLLQLEQISTDLRKKSRLRSINREYEKVRVSDCGKFMGILVGGAGETKTLLLSSAESGFIVGEIEVRGLLEFSLNSISREVTVVTSDSVLVYGMDGKARRELQLRPAVLSGAISCAHIREQRHSDYILIGTKEEVVVLKRDGVVCRRIRMAASAGEAISHLAPTEDFRWIVATVTSGSGSSVRIADVETSKLISDLPLGFVPRSTAISRDKSKLVVVSGDRVMLYYNTHVFRSPAAPADAGCSPAADLSSTVMFSGAPMGRLRNIVMYEYLLRRNRVDGEEREGTRIPFAALLRPGEHSPESAHGQDAAESITMEEAMDPNCPVGSIISYIKRAPSPAKLFAACVGELRGRYDVAEVLLNRVLYYRHKPLMEAIWAKETCELAEERERISGELVEDYLRVMSYLGHRK